jgi:secondary thiamine-phosphate synthase enzyme
VVFERVFSGLNRLENSSPSRLPVWQKMRMVYQKEIQLNTSGHRDLHDLTDEVAGVVQESGLQTGTVHVFHVGSTGALGTIEFEPGLVQDLPHLLDQLIPPQGHYQHEQTWHDGNGHAHLQATLLGPSLTVPIRQGRLALGTWQQIFHLECDVRPRRRTIVVTIQGE